MAKVIIIEVSGDGLIWARLSGQTKPRIIGQMAQPTTLSAATALPMLTEDLIKPMKGILSQADEGDTTVLVLPQATEAQQVVAIVQEFSRASIRVHAVVGRPALAESLANQVLRQGGREAWFLDVLPDSLLLWKLDGTAGPQRIEFGFDDWLARWQAKIRAVFKEGAKVELKEMGGTPLEIERWLEANWTTICGSDSTVEWTTGRKFPAKVESRAVREKLAPMIDELARQIGDQCMPIIPEDAGIVVEDALVRRIPNADVLAKAIPRREITFFATQKYAAVESWLQRNSIAAHTVLWAAQRLHNAPALQWKEPETETVGDIGPNGAASQPYRFERLERSNKRLMVGGISAFVLFAVLLVWTPWLRHSDTKLPAGGADTKAWESRVGMLENEVDKLTQQLESAQKAGASSGSAIERLEREVAKLSQRLEFAQKAADTSGSKVERLESNLEAQRKSMEKKFTELGQQIGAGKGDKSSFDSFTTRELTVVDASGNSQITLGSDTMGGVVRLLTKQGNVAMRLDVLPDGGNVSVHNLQGTSLATIQVSQPNQGIISVLNAAGKRNVILAGDDTGSGSLIVRNNEGTNLVFIGANLAKQGLVKVLNAAGKDITVMAANAEGNGYFAVQDKQEKPLVIMRASTGGAGTVTTLHSSGKPLVSLSADPGNQGLLEINDSRGNPLAQIGGTLRGIWLPDYPGSTDGKTYPGK